MGFYSHRFVWFPWALEFIEGSASSDTEWRDGCNLQCIDPLITPNDYEIVYEAAE